MSGHVTQWANHDQSLRLEEDTKRKILNRIEEKVSSGSGTWIDWQYLMDAVELLRKVTRIYNSQLSTLKISFFLLHKLNICCMWIPVLELGKLV